MTVEGYDLVSVKSVRHQLTRLRNARVLRTRDEAWPLVLTMHPDDWVDLVLENIDDELDRHVVVAPLDGGDATFMGVPVVRDPRMPRGSFTVRWPDDPPLIPEAYR